MKICKNGVVIELTQEEEAALLASVSEQDAPQEMQQAQQDTGALQAEVDELKAALLALIGGDTV